MKQMLRKKFPGLLMLALAIVFFGMTFPSFAQDQQPPVVPAAASPLKSDVAITNLWAINSMPAPSGLVDFTVFFGNLGTQEGAVNVELKIDYDTKNLYNISLGDPASCTDDKTSVVCHYNTLNPGESKTVGFTATVVPTATPDTPINFIASIKSDTPENDPKNDFAKLQVMVTALEKGGKLTGTPANLDKGALDQATTKGNVWLFDVKNDPNWKTDALSTAGLKFLIRGKEALAWTLNITDAGFRNPAIQANYLKVLTVVNGLFILGLLAIAAMWMFSLFIPRRTLRQVIMLYTLAVVFVNFALPINQLLIDGSNLLQQTFIGTTNISDLVDTPTYDNPDSVGYQNETANLKQAASDKITLSLGSDTDPQTASKDIAIGKLQQGFQTPSLTGSITSADGKSVQAIDLNSAGNDPTLRLNTNQGLELTSETTFNPNEENRVFAFLLLLLTGLAYFGMALTFILRIVILWALMIVSPILFLLAVFRSTRGYFYNWLSLYARWLLIGPLMALGIGMVVGIWKAVGMPIVSSYPGVGMFGQLTNVGFYLPGTELANNLSTTPQMMQYLLFLTMLYLPLLFAFMLTRQRMLMGATTTVLERRETERGRAETLRETERGTETKTLTVAEQAKPLASGLRSFLESGLGRTTSTALPASLRANEPREPILMAGSTALPEQLALTHVRDMLGLASGEGEGSRNAHGKAVERLAAASSMPESAERQTLMSVRHEIEERASRSDPEATRVLSEIQEREGSPIGAPMGAPKETPIVEAQTKVTIQPDLQTKLEKGESKPAQTVKTENAEKARAKALEDEGETDEEKKETLKKQHQKKEQDDETQWPNL
jgi:hypothetical protein